MKKRSDELIKQIIALRDYWVGIHPKDSKEAIDGFIHSFLVMCDGDSGTNDFHSILLIDQTDNVVINPVEYLHETFHALNK